VVKRVGEDGDDCASTLHTETIGLYEGRKKQQATEQEKTRCDVWDGVR
jgi:hypothetical protein